MLLQSRTHRAPLNELSGFKPRVLKDNILTCVQVYLLRSSRNTAILFLFLKRLAYPEHLSMIRFLSREASLLTTMAKDTPMTERMAVTPKGWNMLKSMVRTDKGAVCVCVSESVLG